MEVATVEKYAALFSIRTRRGLRKFVLLPRIQDWASTLSGKQKARESSAFYYYELVNTHRGSEYQFDHGEKRFKEAIMEGI